MAGKVALDKKLPSFTRPSTGGALTMCLVAVVLYTPIMYVTDKWIYNRKTKQGAT